MPESETIVATRPNSKSRPTAIEVQNAEPFYGGGAREKRYIKGKVGRTRWSLGRFLRREPQGHEVFLVERKIGERIDEQHFEEMYYALKKAGIPVPPTLRKKEGAPKTYLATDITRDGSVVYGKRLLLARVGDPINSRQRRHIEKMDKLFLKLVEPNSESLAQIESQARELGEKATASGIVLPLDDEAFKLVVHPPDPEHPDGTWDLMCLDWEYADMMDKPFFDHTSPGSELYIPPDMELSEVNNRCISSTLQEVTVNRLVKYNNGLK